MGPSQFSLMYVLVRGGTGSGASAIMGSACGPLAPPIGPLPGH